ncbi:MarR family transcriptional regulator [Mycolicibacterium moriokaense]|nr:MarR family transcriptional regulator [Mycolicibacterium moriokaense]
MDQFDETLAGQTEAVLEASRALVAVAAASIAGVADVVTVPQFRVLVMVYTRGPLNLAAVADDLNVNPSNASRTCDKLIRAGLLDRGVSPHDRRHIVLTLTLAGRRLVEKVTARRRSAIENVLQAMSPDQRDALAKSMSEFAAAAGEAVDDRMLALLWPPTH